MRKVALRKICSPCLAVPLDKIPYIDFPELRFNEHESTEMPFRYVTDSKGEPIMPVVYTFSSSP